MNPNTIYAKIESNTITKTGPRPKWLDDNGNPVTDAILAEHGWLPVIYEQPEHDPLSQRVIQLPQSEWVIEPTRVLVTYSVESIPFEELQAAAHARINAEYTSRTETLATDYPENEQKSWPVQIQEANIVLTGGTEPTPWIDAASTARGVTREYLANLIKAQDTAYRQYHGALTGTRQMLRDMINNVPDGPEAVATLNGINWPE